MVINLSLYYKNRFKNLKKQKKKKEKDIFIAK